VPKPAKKPPAYKTRSKKAAPPPPALEQTPSRQLADAYRTGNMALVAQLRRDLGVSAPVTTRRDALIRTARKAAK
jgi:hypothetical protein